MLNTDVVSSFVLFLKTIYLFDRLKEREISLCDSLLDDYKAGLGQAKDRSQELLLHLLGECRGPNADHLLLFSWQK